MEIIVSKFGGTSMQNSECMLRSAEVAVRRNSFLVVVSATSGTTNQLLELGQKAQASETKDCDELIRRIRQKHLQIAKELGLNDLTELETHLHEMEAIAKGIELLKDFSPRASDALVSLGERISSVLFRHALELKLQSQHRNQNAQWMDARDFLITTEDFGKARPRLDLISENGRKLMAQEKSNLNSNGQPKTVWVTQGFIGRTETGLTTTLGRGGSDYSAALFAEALNAHILEIWTDVAGIATTDPRICPEARSLPEISFKEASELATFGAKVLHPSTLAPAMRKDIPVFVGSSFDPEQRGTWIRRESQSTPILRALALRPRQTLLTLTTPDMLNAHGFLFKIFKVFNDHRISVDAITTSEISVSMTIDDPSVLKGRLIEDLSQFAEVLVEENLSLVSLIGNNVNHTPGIAKRIFEVIADVNVRMICLGASRHNFCFLVSQDKGIEVIQRLHRGFELGLK